MGRKLDNIKKILSILILGLLFNSAVNAGCDDTPVDGVDYSNCQFSEEQDLSRAYIPNSNSVSYTHLTLPTKRIV